MPEMRRLSTRPHKVLLIHAVVVGFEAGLECVAQQMGEDVVVICAHRLTNVDRAFDPARRWFDSTDDRLRALDLASKVGGGLWREAPLGWEDSQALVVFYDGVPNDTPPILWKFGQYEQRNWIPLFPRS